MTKIVGKNADHALAPELGRNTVLLMAAAAGLFVASIYYNQPMLGILAREFGVGPEQVATVAVLTQVGYAVGLLFLASLGDCFERRRLIVITTLGLAASLAWAAAAPSLAILIAASLCLGVLSTVAQQVVPMAAHLAPEHQRGRVVGVVMAGLLSGILLARTISGVVSEYVSWRAMFALAAIACLGMAALLAVRLPRSEPTSPLSYRKTLLSLLGLFRTHAVLRRAGLTQGLIFAAFIAFWADVALYLEQPPFFQGSAVAGLLGLLGMAGILAAPLTGWVSDKLGGGQGKIIIGGAGAVAASFLLFACFPASWAALLGGIVLMDIGVQAAMISNQSRVYALDATARSRLNTVFMTVMFAMGALGSAVGAHAFARFGWRGLSLLGAGCALAALGIEAFGSRRSGKQ
ncbi:MFS transporter [Solidesulfovibrio sp. C21]|uniref:MFS transporter n=1 Tax=Solidesulfovibrio sp. C21 TaxID=3398613 RepID=UPI0039FC4D9E